MNTTEISDFDGRLISNINQVFMTVNGLKCVFHMPEALKRVFSRNGEELAQQLPPGAPRASFCVDEYPACPTSWMHGSGKAASYFVPVIPDKGIWLDMVENSKHTHHVAAVISVQGVNPVTGQKTDNLRLEQYKEKCPIHAVDFKQDLYCEKCKYKWPNQNYISTNSGGMFWLDGFRSENGVVRQWIFTEEEAKGVAAQTIKQDRVFAIGIAFYLSKEPKPIVNPRNILRSGDTKGSAQYTSGEVKWLTTQEVKQKYGSLFEPLSSTTIVPDSYPTVTSSTVPINASYSAAISNIPPDSVAHIDSVACASSGGSTLDFMAQDTLYERGVTKEADQVKISRKRKAKKAPEREEKTSSKITSEKIPEEEIKKFEVGAGAKISQQIFRDPQDLSFWSDEPAGFIYINYVDETTARRIIASGKREEAKEGFLTGLDLAK